MSKEKDAAWIKAVARNLSGTVIPDPEKREQTLTVIQQTIDNRKLYGIPSLIQLFSIQLQYVSPLFWVLQGGFLLMALLLLQYTSSIRGELRDYLWWSSIAAAWMGMLICGDLARHLSRGMAELEQSCYINLPQMWTIRMILAGATDLLILGLCSGGIARSTQTPIWQVSVYLLVPFVLSNLCCLLFITALRGGRSHGSQLALAVVMAMAAVGPSLAVWSYTWNYLWIWVLALIVGVILLAEQLRKCYKKLLGGELLCWN